MPCERGEPDDKDAFKDFRDGFEEDDDPQGGRSVVRWLPGLVKDNPIRVFERGGVVPKGDQRGQEVREEVRVGGIYPLPDRVRHPVGAWCRGVGSLG